LITGGAESYFCKLESNLHYDDFKIYTAAGDGELKYFSNDSID
jgi:hypothetical protein